MICLRLWRYHRPHYLIFAYNVPWYLRYTNVNDTYAFRSKYQNRMTFTILDFTTFVDISYHMLHISFLISKMKNWWKDDCFNPASCPQTSLTYHTHSITKTNHAFKGIISACLMHWTHISAFLAKGLMTTFAWGSSFNSFGPLTTGHVLRSGRRHGPPGFLVSLNRFLRQHVRLLQLFPPSQSEFGNSGAAFGLRHLYPHHV